METNIANPLKQIIQGNHIDIKNQDIKFAISRSTIFSGKSHINNDASVRRSTSRNNLNLRSQSTQPYTGRIDMTRRSY
jgi:hypothetical protein